MKKHNWHVNFMEMVSSRADQPFKWGELDCALFAADAVSLMTGQDLASEFRGKYDSEEGAQKVLSAANGGGLLGVLNDKLEPIDKAFCQRGDVVLFKTDLGPTTGIYWHGGAFSTSPNGVKYFDAIQDRILRAWRV